MYSIDFLTRIPWPDDNALQRLQEVGGDSGAASFYGGGTLVPVIQAPWEMMTPRSFISDEGIGNAFRVLARAMTNGTARRRVTWLMPRIAKAVPFLGYVLICGRRA